MAMLTCHEHRNQFRYSRRKTSNLGYAGTQTLACCNRISHIVGNRVQPITFVLPPEFPTIIHLRVILVGEKNIVYLAQWLTDTKRDVSVVS